MKISEIKRIEELLAKHGGVYGMARALREAEAENERLKEAAEHARLDLVFFGGLYAFDGEAPGETWKLDTSKVVARLDAVLENGQ